MLAGVFGNGVQAAPGYSSISSVVELTTLPDLSVDEKQWLLALPSIIMEVNKDQHTTLETEPWTAHSAVHNANSIQESWGIEDREDLLNILQSLSEGGRHNLKYLWMRLILITFPGKSPEQIREFLGWSYRKQLYYTVMRDNYALTQSMVHIQAWDLGRATSLIRWGFQAAYLTEAEAWNLLVFFGRQIQDQYSSWEDYGNAYSYGRILWGSQQGKMEEYRKETLDIVKRFSAPGGLWRRVEWVDQL